MQPPQTDPTAAVDALTLAVMGSFGQLSLILDHMHRHEDADGPPPPVVLHQLLRDVLRALAEEHDVADIATAAQMLESATRTIGDEVFLVDLSRLRDDDC